MTFDDDHDDYHTPAAVRQAQEVVNMHHELQRLRAENRRLREVEGDYNQLLNDSLENGRRTIGGLLQIVMTPGVFEACQAEGKRRAALDQ